MYYSFDGIFSGAKGIEELSLTVQLGNVVGSAVNTKLVFKPHSRSIIDPGFIVPRIYLGRLANWAPYSVDQTLLAVIPGEKVAEGNDICLFWQWTVSADGKKMQNIEFTAMKMMNVENVATGVSFFRFTTGYYIFQATMQETAERQQLTLNMTNLNNVSTGPLKLELQDLGPPPSGRQPRETNNSTAVVVNDIVGGFPNEGSSLTRSLVEMGSKMVKITNTRLELSEKLNVLLEQAVRDKDGVISQLESKLQAAQDQIELLNKKLLETKAARERDRMIAQETQDQRESESELSDDEDILNQPALHDAKEDDFNNQSLLYDFKVDEFHNNQPT
jgi:FtsZ-binding cell division protein ZapB